MSSLREALEALARNLRADATNHGVDARHPRLVLENRAADVDRILANHVTEPVIHASAIDAARDEKLRELLADMQSRDETADPGHSCWSIAYREVARDLAAILARSGDKS